MDKMLSDYIYEASVPYSGKYVKNTKVIRCSCRNSELIGFRTDSPVLGDRDVKVKMTEAARATGVDVRDGQVVLTLEADVAAEMSALTRVWVRAYDLAGVLSAELDGDEDLSDSGFSSGTSTGTGTGSGSGR